MATVADVERALARQPPQSGVMVYDAGRKPFKLLAERPPAKMWGTMIVFLNFDLVSAT